MDQLGICSNIVFPTECADYHHCRTLNSIATASNLKHATCKDKPKSVPYRTGSVSRDPVPLRQVHTHVTPPVGRLEAVALLTSFHNGSVSGNPVPLRQVRTHVTPPVGRLGAVTLLTSFHNDSISRD
ncbi:MAG TPA: hypothetical protein IAB96_06865 [Candidatus Coprenecus pullicola]|nr:hypothetical protein [Candidatus Coprenecus pullicola]